MATPYLGYSNTDWERSAATTLANHIRDVEQDWMRNYQLLALLESNDRISYDNAGRGFDWPLQYRIHNVEGNTGETARNFARRNLFKTAALPYRGYQATDAIYKKELLENRGEAAIVKLWDGFTDRLEKSMKQGLATEPYVDGNATGNETMWHGFESFLNATQTITITTNGTPAARTANAADPVCYPNDSYASLSTVLGTFGGSQDANSVWPAGTADPEFDAWSPVIINALSSYFTGGTWVLNAQDAMRYLIIHSQRNSSILGQLTNIFLNRDGYRIAITAVATKEQIHVIPGAPNALRSLGFKNVFNFDGIEISWETGVPATDPAATTRTMFGYGFNWQNVELMCMEDTIMKTEGPIYDIDTQAYKGVVYTLSNLKFEEIRNVGKITDLAH